jgi:RNA polymerase sigma-70 factor (ECF subfamily)
MPESADSATLATILAEARRAWPGIEVPPARFYAHLAEIDEAAGDRHTNDLYLALACVSGSPEALAAFDAHCGPELATILRRSRGGRLQLDDVRQMVHERLFVAQAGAEPKIATYTGRSSLRAWFRVVVTRLVLNAVTRGPKDLPAAEDDSVLLDGLADGDPNVEIGHMKALYASELRSVFPIAFGRLSVHERMLLRQRYLDGLSHDEISTAHGVHRATVKRQLARARDELAGAIRELLKERLRVSDAELESILRLLQSNFHITMQRFL